MSIKTKKASELQAIDKNAAWLVEGILPLNSLALLSAPPKHGKSMIALDLLTSVSGGAVALGQYAAKTKAKSIYVALEDAESIIQGRLNSFCYHKGLSVNDLDLHIVIDQVLLIDTVAGQQALEALIKDQQPGFLVLDNLSRIHTSNENNAGAMGKIFEWLQMLKRKYNLTILMITHSGKGSRIRGSSQIDSYYEAAIFLKTVRERKLMDLSFRGYPSEKDIPYQIITEGKALRIGVGSPKAEDTGSIIQRTEHVYDVDKLIQRGELIEIAPGVVTYKPKG